VREEKMSGQKEISVTELSIPQLNQLSQQLEQVCFIIFVL